MKKIAFMIAGITSGTGKTTATQGILSLLIKKGLNVRSFKLGPDYIDSSYHAKITGTPCINLDKFLLTPFGENYRQKEILKETFYSYAETSDALVVEGVGGLFDDWNNDGNNPAQIAIDLGIPILLIADGFSFCQTLGIMLNPLFEYNPELKIAGVVLNKISSDKHFEKIIEPISPQHKDKIIGYISADEKLFINERHLGLITESETDNISERTNYLAEIFSRIINLDFILQLNVEIPLQYLVETISHQKYKCRIAVARDKAFSFHYQYNLDCLERLGAELVYFSPINDKALPYNIDGIYLGGGFPEVFASELSANTALINQIKTVADNGMPIYAECGGLMYLCEDLGEFETNKKFKSVGIFPMEANMNAKLSLSYAVGELSQDCLIGSKGDTFKGHIFHKSQVIEKDNTKKSCIIKSIDAKINLLEGYSYKNVYASYLHIHFKSCQLVAESFINKASQNCIL
ncbi:MAG: cobyrinate a,c-diamide synthase [Fusobacteria bacterium]|nr:cobyrinate a,c-diamide synthase [Fusobacteriota bacterium]